MCSDLLIELIIEKQNSKLKNLVIYLNNTKLLNVKQVRQFYFQVMIDDYDL